MLAARDLLLEQGISAEVIKLNTITPFDFKAIIESVSRTKYLLVAEECAAGGCVGETIAAGLLERGVTLNGFRMCNLGHGFIQHGPTAELKKRCGLDGEGLARAAREVIEHGEKET